MFGKYKLPDSGLRKYQPPQNPITQEINRKEWGAPPFYKEKFIEDKVAREIDSLSNYAKTGDEVAKSKLAAMEFYCVNQEILNTAAEADKKVMESFRDFLLGKSHYNENLKTVPWGKKKLVGKDIDAYLESMMNAKIAYDRQLVLMDMKGIPSNLQEAWLFFCFKCLNIQMRDDLFLRSWSQYYPDNAPIFSDSTNIPASQRDLRDKHGGDIEKDPETVSRKMGYRENNDSLPVDSSVHDKNGGTYRITYSKLSANFFEYATTFGYDLSTMIMDDCELVQNRTFSSIKKEQMDDGSGGDSEMEEAIDLKKKGKIPEELNRELEKMYQQLEEEHIKTKQELDELRKTNEELLRDHSTVVGLSLKSRNDKFREYSMRLTEFLLRSMGGANRPDSEISEDIENLMQLSNSVSGSVITGEGMTENERNYILDAEKKLRGYFSSMQRQVEQGIAFQESTNQAMQRYEDALKLLRTELKKVDPRLADLVTHEEIKSVELAGAIGKLQSDFARISEINAQLQEGGPSAITAETSQKLVDIMKENDRLNSEVADSEKKLHNLQEKLKTMEKEDTEKGDTITTSMAEKQATIDRLESEKLILQRQLRLTESRISEKIESLEAPGLALQVENSKLIALADQLRGDLDSINRDKANLQTELQNAQKELEDAIKKQSTVSDLIFMEKQKRHVYDTLINWQNKLLIRVGKDYGAKMDGKNIRENVESLVRQMQTNSKNNEERRKAFDETFAEIAKRFEELNNTFKYETSSPVTPPPAAPKSTPKKTSEVKKKATPKTSSKK